MPEQTFYFMASHMDGKEFCGFTVNAVDSEAAFVELHALIEKYWPNLEIHLEEVTFAIYSEWLDPSPAKVEISDDEETWTTPAEDGLPIQSLTPAKLSAILSRYPEFQGFTIGQDNEGQLVIYTGLYRDGKVSE